MAIVEEFGATLLHGDCREVLKTLPAESVHCVVTSPPYWGLRDYGTGEWEGGDPACDHSLPLGDGGAVRVDERIPFRTGKQYTHQRVTGNDCRCGARRVDRQIGLEPTPEEHVAALVVVFREVKRVLRSDGVLWLNYGDCYAGNPHYAGGAVGGANGSDHKPYHGGYASGTRGKISGPGLKPKDLVGMPWRVAFALQADGWWLRSDIIWSKPNPMPESVTDRPTRAHEYVFLLTKSARYFYDADAIREPDVSGHGSGNGFKRAARLSFLDEDGPRGNETPWTPGAGRNKRTVWTINSQPFAEAHFATFPEALIEPCVMAGTSEWGCCPKCGAPWERVVEKVGHQQQKRWTGAGRENGCLAGGGHEGRTGEWRCTMTTTGWQPTCTCKEPETVPCVVLDPFAGSGTVGKVATRLGRRSLLIDLNEAYMDIARERNAQLGLMV